MMSIQSQSYSGIIKYTVLSWQEKHKKVFEESAYQLLNFDYNEDDRLLHKLKCFDLFMSISKKIYQNITSKSYDSENMELFYKNDAQEHVPIRVFTDFDNFIRNAGSNLKKPVEVIIKPKGLMFTENEKATDTLRKQWDIILVCRSCGNQVLCPDCNTNLAMPVKASKKVDKPNATETIDLTDADSFETSMDKLVTRFSEAVNIRYPPLLPSASQRIELNPTHKADVRPTLSKAGIQSVNNILKRAQTDNDKKFGDLKANGQVPKEHSSLVFDNQNKIQHIEVPVETKTNELPNLTANQQKLPPIEPFNSDVVKPTYNVFRDELDNQTNKINAIEQIKIVEKSDKKGMPIEKSKFVKEQEEKILERSKMEIRKNEIIESFVQNPNKVNNEADLKLNQDFFNNNKLNAVCKAPSALQQSMSLNKNVAIPSALKNQNKSIESNETSTLNSTKISLSLDNSVEIIPTARKNWNAKNISVRPLRTTKG